MISNMRNLIMRRGLVATLVAAELRASTLGSRIGWLWWFLDPALLMLVYWGVVVGVFGQGADRYKPYPIFLFVALATWKHLTTSVTKAIGVLRSRDRLIRSISFPTIALPVALAFSGFAYFLSAFVVLVVAALVWPSPHHSGALAPVLQIPLLMIAQLAIVMGACMTVACYGLFFPDLRMVASHLLRIGFYVSPGLYGADLVYERVSATVASPWSGAIVAAYMANPFAIIFTGYRDSLINGQWIAWQHWATLAVESGFLLIAGYRVYQYHDRRVLKFL